MAVVVLTALGFPETPAALVAATGLAGHAGWDAWTWRANHVVARSFAQWCGALDIVLAVDVVTLTLT